MTEIVTKSPIRVLLVDDHPVVRAGLNSMLRKQTGLKIIGSLHGGREALEFLAKEPPMPSPHRRQARPWTRRQAAAA